jgi:hypothetical protein
MPGSFVARASRWRLLLLMAGSVGFVAIGLWIIGAFGDAPPASPMKVLFAGWVGVPFFGLCALVALRQMVTAGDLITVDHRGIKSHPFSDAFIPWHAIAAIEQRTISRQEFLCLTLHDPGAFRPRRHFRPLASADRSLGYGDVALSTSITDKTMEQLAEATRQHRC